MERVQLINVEASLELVFHKFPSYYKVIEPMVEARASIRPVLDVVETVVRDYVMVDGIDFDVKCFFDESARLKAIRVDQ
jgi:hypothetical protein